MAKASSIMNYRDCSPLGRPRKHSLFPEDDDLSIDLNDNVALTGDIANSGRPDFPQQSQNQMERSFLSDLPEDFLTPGRHENLAHSEGAPASGADGHHLQQQYAGMKRRRIMVDQHQQPGNKWSNPSQVSVGQGQLSTQMSSQAAYNHKVGHQYAEQFEVLSRTGEVLQDQTEVGGGNLAQLNNLATDSSLDSVAAMRRSKNREAARRSRMKKKVEQNSLQFSNDKVVKENNKLKLDNAALRAENQILKRQLNYWENLFAKKTQSQQVAFQSNYEHQSSGTYAHSHSARSAVSGGEMTRQARPSPSQQELQLHSEELRKNANNGKAPSACANEDEGEISFVLERNVSASPTGNKLGIFSLALIMCICCFSSIFGPDVITTPGLNDGSVQMSSVGGQMQPHGTSMSLQEASVNNNVAGSDKIADGHDPVAEASKQVVVTQTFLQVVLHAVWVNLLKLVFLVAFALCLLLFPKDEVVQWAARKPFFRRLFDFSDVPIAAQTKFIKSDKLV